MIAWRSLDSRTAWGFRAGVRYVLNRQADGDWTADELTGYEPKILRLRTLPFPTLADAKLYCEELQ